MAVEKLYNGSVIEVLTGFLKKIDDVRGDSKNKPFLMIILNLIKYIIQNVPNLIGLDQSKLFIS